ncbi:MAG: hypothetical protein M0Z62_07380 [Actinomycetota bacterium]|nr:hypothetical protein [Actinomycetota bacterium]
MAALAVAAALATGCTHSTSSSRPGGTSTDAPANASPASATTVAPACLTAVHFVSPQAGVALTSPSRACAPPPDGQGTVRMAVSDDGGSH